MDNQTIPAKTYRSNDSWKEGINYYLSFIVWPFGVLLAASRKWDRPWSKNVFWLFCIFVGFTFIIGKEGTSDSDRYARMLITYAHSNMSLMELWKSFYSEGSNYVDILSPLITFLVSRVTNNPKILFTIFAFIFGYFYSRNIWYILDRINGKLTAIVLLYILTFALFNPIWNINGFRMWTAAQIFLYGALPYLLESNTKRLYWSGISILLHFSFLFPLTILFLFIFLGNKLNIYLTFFIITSFIKEIDLQGVRALLLLLPDIFQAKVIVYTNPAYAETISNMRQSINWYLPFSEMAIEWITYFLTFFIYFFCRKSFLNRQSLMRLFCFSLLLYSCANISSLVPSGGRFLVVANTFMFAFFIFFISIHPRIRGMLLIKSISIPFLLLFCMVSIRMGMDYYGLMTIFGNPILAAVNTNQVQLITGMKELLH